MIGYEEIGHELVAQFLKGIDTFYSAVRVAGMTIGIARVLEGKSPETRNVVLEPASSPIITLNRAGTYHVEGIRIGFTSPFLDTELYDEARPISESERRAMCRRLAKEDGLLVGTSTGLNVVAAIALASELGPGKKVVTVTSDTGLKYMSGDLVSPHFFGIPSNGQTSSPAVT